MEYPLIKIRIPHNVNVFEYLSNLPPCNNPEDFIIYFGHSFITEESTYMVTTQGISLEEVEDFLKNNPGEIIQE